MNLFVTLMCHNIFVTNTYFQHILKFYYHDIFFLIILLECYLFLYGSDSPYYFPIYLYCKIIELLDSSLLFIKLAHRNVKRLYLQLLYS